MNKIKKDIEDGIKLICKKVNLQDLKPSDHIYAYKQYGFYSHHGIYVGGGYVIHFKSPANKVAILSLSRVEPKTATTCPECGYRENTGRGVIKTCLDCFRRDGNTLQSIHYFMYGVPLLSFLLKKRGSCSTITCTRSPEKVVEAAYELLRSDGFGQYDLTSNNCEHFATYCQTGVRASMQTTLVPLVG
ncbi:hypothetical protein ACJRO7_032737 [Eucalyptus globulus]|uniref:LRAT domain-containing protein n=1 Tax=Eucalyptus globulus TaxID=34317 RepID=A0ABD3JKK4_EUCGL